MFICLFVCHKESNFAEIRESNIQKSCLSKVKHKKVGSSAWSPLDWTVLLLGCTQGEVYEGQKTESIFYCSIFFLCCFGHCFISETFTPKNANMFTSDICRVTGDLSSIQGHISGTRHHLWVEDSHCQDNNAICQLYLQP